MKKFISGFLAGALFFGAIGAVAVSYVAEDATFKVMVNGSEFVSDKPVVAIEGSTYLPLKAIGEVLNVPVKWNDELHQVEVGEGSPEETTNKSEADDGLTDIEILTTKEDKTYKENPDVINLGNVLGINSYRAVASDDIIAYYYDVSDISNPLAYYEAALEQNNYSVSRSGSSKITAFSRSHVLDFSYYITAETANGKAYVMFTKIN